MSNELVVEGGDSPTPMDGIEELQVEEEAEHEWASKAQEDDLDEEG